MGDKYRGFSEEEIAKAKGNKEKFSEIKQTRPPEAENGETEIFEEVVEEIAMEESAKYFRKKEATVNRILEKMRSPPSFALETAIKEMQQTRRVSKKLIRDALNLGGSAKLSDREQTEILGVIYQWLFELSTDGIELQNDAELLANIAITKVKNNYKVERSIQEAQCDFERQAGWYFETEEGRVALERIKEEVRKKSAEL